MKSKLLLLAAAIGACSRPLTPDNSGPLPLACPVDSFPQRARIEVGAPGSISITLIDAATGRQLDAASFSFAILQYPGGRRVRVDGPRPFQFAGLQTGRYVSGVTRFGYNSRSDTVDLGETTGQRLILPMTLQPNDACGSLAEVRVINHRPWWKLW
jgi:hypothetical protein